MHQFRWFIQTGSLQPRRPVGKWLAANVRFRFRGETSRRSQRGTGDLNGRKIRDWVLAESESESVRQIRDEHALCVILVVDIANRVVGVVPTKVTSRFNLPQSRILSVFIKNQINFDLS